MKISKKTLGIIFGSIAGASIIAGGTMFGVGGNQTTTVSFGGIETTFGSGMLNFESAKVGGVTYEKYLQNQADLINNSKDIIQKAKDAIAALEQLPPATVIPGSGTVGQALEQARQALKAAEDGLVSANNAITMNNVAVAGLIIMVLGLTTGAITGAIALFNWKKSRR